MGMSPLSFSGIDRLAGEPDPGKFSDGHNSPNLCPRDIVNTASQAIPRSLARDKASVIVDAVEDLPPMPRVVTKALELLGDPESSMKDLAEALNKDPALVARIIRGKQFRPVQQRGSTLPT